MEFINLRIDLSLVVRIDRTILLEPLSKVASVRETSSMQSYLDYAIHVLVADERQCETMELVCTPIKHF